MTTPRDTLESRFIPGQVLAGRYRVVERVGAGGMGEVYRAFDLKLGQAVALKFLPQELAYDPERMQALFAEVRLARQVTHPNVCRVHDIEEMDGTHFLTMEFVDGEDLASLLRRIGRLPADKTVAIAHELCAGLAAVHERGLLHRDLKPANVMIDGVGHVRLTDFGLAQLQGSGFDPDMLVGTPTYMAPETMTGAGPPSVASDLYAFGLMMYEVCAGRPAHEAPTLRELIRLRCETVPPPPSKFRPDIESGVERAIMRCLERDPAQRPKSARAVAAGLPGGDLLARAVAAGETPSPQLVAAVTGESEGLPTAVAWSCAVALVIGLAVLTAVSPLTRLVPSLPLTDPPEVLAAHAGDVLRGTGDTRSGVDRASGFDFDERVIDRIAEQDHSAARWRDLARRAPEVVSFWYRESPVEMTPAAPWFRVRWLDPPPLVAGMVGVRLDATGRVAEVATGPHTIPPPDRPRPSVVLRSTRPAVFLAALLAGAWLARRNLRARRGDTRRALRVAAGMVGLRLVTWLLGGHIALGSLTEQIATTIAWSLYDFAYGWVIYVAVEPYLRRLWPRLITSWARLVDGRHDDARVGRELLLGCLAGTVIALAVAGHQAAPALWGGPPGRPDNVGYVEHQLASLLGLRAQLAEIFGLLRSSVVTVMGFVVILVAARVVLRQAAAAWVLASLIFVPIALPKGDVLALDLAFAAVITLLLVLVMMRGGLLAATVALMTNTVLQSAPLGMGMASWPAGRTVLALGLVLAVGLYGCARSLAGRPMFADVLSGP